MAVAVAAVVEVATHRWAAAAVVATAAADLVEVAAGA
jgi:hypothetical protein